MRLSPNSNHPWPALLLAAMLLPPSAAAPGAAQEEPLPPGFPLDAAQRAMLCGPRLEDERPARPFRLAGSEEGPLRRMYGPTEELVVAGGVADGLEAGQLYAVRRPGLHRLQPPELQRRDTPVVGVRTLGVIRILAVDQELSTADVLEMCEGFVEGDYLVPFQRPEVPAATLVDAPPDYAQSGLVLFGDPSRRIVAPGDMVVTDQGAGTVTPGQAVTFYRPALVRGGPVHEVAWGVVMEVAASSSMVRIDRARDAVFSGDLVAPHEAQ